MSQRYEQTVSLIDDANRQDPNIVTEDGEQWPKELLYGQRMSEMLERFAPASDEIAKLAIRAQHIQRWKSPRSDYPMDRTGYYQWRTQLYQFHADTVAELMLQAGYDAQAIGRVKDMVGKKGIKLNPDTQLLEDIANLVFIEHYMLDFAGKHPEYSEEKWIEIIQKTWKKMSEAGQKFALAGMITLPVALTPLIQKALSN
ncbi:MAG: DUF4202 domain-containing protein [Gammaproteobacteria bacterium]|nr:DUF4202 domain-containing protein [Gammaproteobacteria bacterium]